MKSNQALYTSLVKGESISFEQLYEGTAEYVKDVKGIHLDVNTFQHLLQVITLHNIVSTLIKYYQEVNHLRILLNKHEEILYIETEDGTRLFNKVPL